MGTSLGNASSPPAGIKLSPSQGTKTNPEHWFGFGKVSCVTVTAVFRSVCNYHSNCDMQGQILLINGITWAAKLFYQGSTGLHTKGRGSVSCSLLLSSQASLLALCPCGRHRTSSQSSTYQEQSKELCLRTGEASSSRPGKKRE